MYDVERIRSLLRSRQAYFSLPREFYRDPEIHNYDLDAIFYRSWIMVGFTAELPEVNSYLSTQIGESPILLIRTSEDEIVGHHNTCRHRGSQLCVTGTGKIRNRIVCPYHQWSYDVRGGLLSTRNMNDQIDRKEFGLRPVRVEVVEGCIYVSLSDSPPDFEPYRQTLAPALAPYNLWDAKVAHVMELHEEANWKLVMENGRECYHCQAGHPEFNSMFPPITPEYYDFKGARPKSDFDIRMDELGLGIEPKAEDWWQVARFPLKKGHKSFSLDSDALVKKPFISLNDGELGSLRWATEPNSLCHVSSDTAFMLSVMPESATTCTVTAKWLVHKDAVEGEDYDVDKLIHAWDQTNRQDRAFAENNQKGINGAGYVPGPYSLGEEVIVLAFVDWYCEAAKRFLEENQGS